ncbi:MAG TPA: hypothetical protein VJU84_02195 [Pyrinomonadaceae bacterium]|nr:hypothetical protein [Pyrinomonadaceae bacterium]
MNAYLIGYDLNRPRGASDYPDLIKAIKSLGESWHQLDSTWIVRSELSAYDIATKLNVPLIDEGDELFVAQLTKPNAAWINLDTPTLTSILRL